MVNYYNPRRADHDEEYDRWRRHGHERGFFRRAMDRISSWFSSGTDPYDEREYWGTYGNELYGSKYEHRREPNRSYGQQYGEQTYGTQGPIDRWTLGGIEFGDFGTRPSQRGRGPRNYQRNDERIREEIIERITQHHDIDGTDLEIEVQGGDVTLKGMVESRWDKRLAEDICEDIFGVKNVMNHVKVRQMMNLPRSEREQGEPRQKQQRTLPGGNNR